MGTGKPAHPLVVKQALLRRTRARMVHASVESKSYTSLYELAAGEGCEVTGDALVLHIPGILLRAVPIPILNVMIRTYVLVSTLPNQTAR